MQRSLKRWFEELRIHLDEVCSGSSCAKAVLASRKKLGKAVDSMRAMMDS